MSKLYFVEFETDQYHMIVNLKDVALVATKDDNHTLYVELSNGKPIVVSSNYPVCCDILGQYKHWLINLGGDDCQLDYSFNFTKCLDECQKQYEELEKMRQNSENI